ncbi:hypothetical protein B0H10DRAFT_2229691 [Mycena sp. CBHHK59/15]|nr:hypothetical protein B0H10DRAFT_2229691 [Mycena sp. CBHHK59/15]
MSPRRPSLPLLVVMTSTSSNPQLRPRPRTNPLPPHHLPRPTIPAPPHHRPTYLHHTCTYAAPLPTASQPYVHKPLCAIPTFPRTYVVALIPHPSHDPYPAHYAADAPSPPQSLRPLHSYGPTLAPTSPTPARTPTPLSPYRCYLHAPPFLTAAVLRTYPRTYVATPTLPTFTRTYAYIIRAGLPRYLCPPYQTPHTTHLRPLRSAYPMHYVPTHAANRCLCMRTINDDAPQRTRSLVDTPLRPAHCVLPTAPSRCRSPL